MKTEINHNASSAETLCSPKTTWMCPACGRRYQAVRQRDELAIVAKCRCVKQHIEEGCHAYAEQSANAQGEAQPPAKNL